MYNDSIEGAVIQTLSSIEAPERFEKYGIAHPFKISCISLIYIYIYKFHRW